MQRGPPPPFERLAVVDFYPAEDCREQDRASQADTSSGNAKLARRAGKFSAHAPNRKKCENGSGDTTPDINVDEIGDREFRQQTINHQRDGNRARRRCKAGMYFAEPRRQIAILRHRGGKTRGGKDWTDRKRTRARGRSDKQP